MQVYSGNTVPFGPTGLLTTTWRTAASSELSGYAQQDAHEFFISALNQIHATCKGSTKSSCICIVHTTFDGSLQSDVECERCGNVNSTSDPMLDISLGLEMKGLAAGDEITLQSCLRRCVARLPARFCVIQLSLSCTSPPATTGTLILRSSARTTTPVPSAARPHTYVTLLLSVTSLYVLSSSRRYNRIGEQTPEHT